MTPSPRRNFRDVSEPVIRLGAMPVSMVVTAGRYRDNRRGKMHVEAVARGLGQIVISQPGGEDALPTITRITLAGGNLEAAIDRLRTLADLLEKVDTDAWTDLEDSPETRRFTSTG